MNKMKKQNNFKAIKIKNNYLITPTFLIIFNFSNLGLSNLGRHEEAV